MIATCEQLFIFIKNWQQQAEHTVDIGAKETIEGESPSFHGYTVMAALSLHQDVIPASFPATSVTRTAAAASVPRTPPERPVSAVDRAHGATMRDRDAR